MKRLEIAPLTTWITAAAVAHGAGLPDVLVERLAVTRRRALALLRRLESAQWLVREGPARRPSWRPGALRQVVRQYAIAGGQEDLPWRHDFEPFFALPPEVARMAQHAFTELLNNAIDHSGGRIVTVSMRQTSLQLQMLVSDDGCGLFERIAQAFAIDEPALAMLELAKGKLTSQPHWHAGHGLFFTARLADVFDLHANGRTFRHRPWQGPGWHAAPAFGATVDRPGTAVYLAIALDTPRTLDAVLRESSLDAASYAFERTRVPLALIASGTGVLASRAEARRVASRLTQFRRAEIDFDGLDAIGHGFADELFRVFAREQPGVELVPVAAAPRVAEMLRTVRAG